MKTFTEKEVQSLLVGVFLYAEANNKQGISSIKGQNYGEQADTVIKAFKSIQNTEKSLLSMVSQLRGE